MKCFIFYYSYKCNYTVKTNIYIINDPTNVMLITETLKLIYSIELDSSKIIKLTITLTTTPWNCLLLSLLGVNYNSRNYLFDFFVVSVAITSYAGILSR